MALDTSWFTEPVDATGTAFSLKLGEKLVEEQTPYQKIEIFRTETFGYLMVIDGCTMVSTRDNFLYHEMMSHVALNSHPAPRNVVVVGGGDCGTLREVLKHPEVLKATQVEIDERVTRLAEKYFPELCEANGDPRAELLFIDGIKYMAECEPESLDLVIVDSTDPVGPAEGLFNAAFYTSCYKALRHGGILVQQSESPLVHLDLIKSMRVAMKSAGFQAAKTLSFPQPCYPTGWWSCTMVRKGADLAGFRERGAASKQFPTRYYNADMHRAALALPEYVREALGE